MLGLKLSKYTQSSKGFTLVELLIVIVIMGVLSAIAVPMYTKYITNAKAAEAVLGITAIRSYVHSYRRAHGEWPSSTPIIPSITNATEKEWFDKIVSGDSIYRHGIKPNNTWIKHLDLQSHFIEPTS